MASQFNVGDPVWAKMKGFSPWPAKIVEPTKDVKRPTMKKPMQFVFFFGSKNYAWILDELINPYEENKEKFSRQCKTTNFKEALKAISEYIQNLPKQPVKTTELPSIDEEIATIFPNGSNKASQHRDYSRTPFQGKNKAAVQNDVAKSNATVTKNRTHKENEKIIRKIGTKKTKKDKSNSPLFGNFTTKRTSSESSSSFSKRSKVIDKFNTLLSNSTSNYSGSVLSSLPLTSTTGLPSSQYVNSSPSKQSGLLARPAYVARPASPPLDIEKPSITLKQKRVKPCHLQFGFLGLGIMGRGIVKNLLNSGHNVTVWNRSPNKLRDFVKAGAVKGQTPADVVAASDITFCCVSDPLAAKEMVFGNCGVLQEIRNNKGYVEMTSVDPETSQDIAEAIIARGGRYLEAPLSGSRRPAEEGTLIILAAGDRSLFNDCGTCFQAMGKHAFYLGEIGNGSKMNLVINMVLGTTLAGLAEGMALADRAGLSQKDLLEILELGPLNCPVIREKGQAIIEGIFPTNMPLHHMQKDLHLALGIGDQLEQPLPLTAAANEVFKHAKRLSYGEHDISAVYLRARF